jgi:hypothetical protein
MKAIQLLKEQLKSAHNTQENTIKDVQKTNLHFSKVKKALPVGAAYAHSVIGEDIVLSTMLANKKPISLNNPNTGLSEPMPSFSQWDKHEKWAKSVQIDLPKLQKFAKKVYQTTEDYIDTLSEKDLDREFDLSGMGAGKQNLAYILNNFIILHIANLTGEISAIKGIQGLKGYPF